MSVIEDELVVEGLEVRVVRINRPSRGNSVTPDLMNKFTELLDNLENDHVTRAVIITGVGKIFCSGGDLKEIGDIYLSSGHDALREYELDTWMPSVQRAFWRLWNLRLPTVAAINGSATGGGLDLALCCDYRIAVDSARFGESYANLGLVPVGGGGYLLPLISRRGTATRMLISGKLIDARTALSAGVVDEVVGIDLLMARAQVVADDFTCANPDTAAQIKDMLREPHRDGFRTNLQESLACNRTLLESDVVQKRREVLLASFTNRVGKD